MKLEKSSYYNVLLGPLGRGFEASAQHARLTGAAIAMRL